MHDDEFLSQFRKDPRPEFAEALRAKLASEESSEKGNTMTRIVSFPPAPSNPESTQAAQPLRRGYSITLVATVVLAVLFGAIIVINRSNNVAAPISRLTNSAFEYGGQVTSLESDEAVAAMQQAGMTWMKIEKHYSGALASDSVADIEAAHANGFKVLINARGTSRAMQGNTESYIQSYANWLGELAADGADAIEIWDEPNTEPMFMWSGPEAGIQATWYVDMLRLSSQAIKVANPNTLVISAASASTGAEIAWLRSLIEQDGLQYLDCVGVQYTDGVLPPDALTGDPRDSYYMRYFPSVLSTYLSIVGSQKPLCITEIGYLSPEGLGTLPDLFAWASNITVAQQAEWLTQAAIIAAETGSVRLMIVRNVDYTTAGGYLQKAYAIVRPDGSCLACDALARIR